MRILNLKNKVILNSSEKKFLESLNNDSIIIFDLDKISQRFNLAMKRSKEIFGEHSFRKSYPGKRRTPINKGLFEVWGNLLGRLSDEQFLNLKINKSPFIAKHTELLNDENFIIVISRDSQKFSSVKTRYEKLNELLNQFINA